MKTNLVYAIAICLPLLAIPLKSHAADAEYGLDALDSDTDKAQSRPMLYTRSADNNDLTLLGGGIDIKKNFIALDNGAAVYGLFSGALELGTLGDYDVVGLVAQFGGGVSVNLPSDNMGGNQVKVFADLSILMEEYDYSDLAGTLPDFNTSQSSQVLSFGAVTSLNGHELSAKYEMFLGGDRTSNSSGFTIAAGLTRTFRVYLSTAKDSTTIGLSFGY